MRKIVRPILADSKMHTWSDMGMEKIDEILREYDLRSIETALLDVYLALGYCEDASAEESNAILSKFRSERHLKNIISMCDSISQKWNEVN